MSQKDMESLIEIFRTLKHWRDDTLAEQNQRELAREVESEVPLKACNH